jgi:hypothetical protein
VKPFRHDCRGCRRHSSCGRGKSATREASAAEPRSIGAKQEMAQAPPCSISLCRSCAVWLSEIPAFLLVIAARGSAQIRQSATPKYGVALHAALARFVVAVAHYCSIFHGSLLLSNFLASVTHLTLLGRSRTLLWLGVQQAAR